MPNAQKVAKVKEIAEQLSAAQAAMLAGYRGLTVQEAAELREALTEVETRFSIVKNSLTRLAVKEAGLEALDELIDGPTAIAYVQGDPVAAAKRLVEQSRRFPVLEVRGGVAEGRVLSADDFRRFADLQPRDVMLAQLAGLAKSQIARTAWMMQALQSKFLLLLQALKDKLPEDDTAPDSGAEEPEAGASPEGTPVVTEGDPTAPEQDSSETEQASKTQDQEEGGA
jgi:large subunit ribosomal protein L10